MFLSIHPFVLSSFFSSVIRIFTTSCCLLTVYGCSLAVEVTKGIVLFDAVSVQSGFLM